MGETEQISIDLTPVLTGIGLVFTMLIDELERSKLVDRERLGKKLQLIESTVERLGLPRLDDVSLKVIDAFTRQLVHSEPPRPLKLTVITGGKSG